MEQIKELIQPVIDEQGVELVDIELKGRPGSQILRVIVDTESGITLDQCIALNRMLSDVMDMEDPIKGRYTLEVTSPGVDRPLKNINDFRRNLGRDVVIELVNENGELSRKEGKLITADEKCLVLETKKGDIEILLTQVIKGKVQLPW